MPLLQLAQLRAQLVYRFRIITRYAALADSRSAALQFLRLVLQRERLAERVVNPCAIVAVAALGVVAALDGLAERDSGRHNLGAGS